MRKQNSRQLCKPSTASRFCITVQNSPNSPDCLDEAMETRKTSSIAEIVHLRCGLQTKERTAHPTYIDNKALTKTGVICLYLCVHEMTQAAVL